MVLHKELSDKEQVCHLFYSPSSFWSPLIEIAVFIEVGGWIGLWPTIAIVILTAMIGTALLRAQGIATLNRARQQMDRGALPARELFDGLCLLFAGALLLTPGFVTDAVGFLLFVPPVRDSIRGFLRKHMDLHIQGGGFGPGPARRPSSAWASSGRPPSRRPPS